MSIIILGSNTFIDCEKPLVIDQRPVFQVSTDKRGALQISLDVASPPARQLIKVAENVVTSEETEVLPAPDSVMVRFRGEKVADVRRVGEMIHVDLDLRSLGISIYSDEKALHLGSSVFSGNTIQKSAQGIVLSTAEG